MVDYELRSNEKVDTPRIVKWLIHNYEFSAEEVKPTLVRTLAEGYGLKPTIAKKLLEKEIDFKVQGSTITFKVKEDDEDE